MLKRKPLALDLFCGGGGACIGMQRAGFEVVGIDIKPHKNYPGHFIQADVHNLPVLIDDFDFVWASPPCQRFTPGAKCSRNPNNSEKYPYLVEPTRRLLAGHPFTCIENVPGSPLRLSLILNGPSVGLNWVQRKRFFELSFWMWQVELPKCKGIRFSICKSRSPMNPIDDQMRKRLGLPMSVPKDVAKCFMGIPQEQHMTDSEIGESVAPPMAEYIAKEALRQMQRR